MAEEALSRAELETLLRTAQSETNAASGASNEAITVRPARVAASEFKSPQRADRGQLCVLARIHDALARGFAEALGTLLRFQVSVKLRAVDEITFGEFRAALEDPGCSNVLRASPLASPLILGIERAILYPMLDRMLGGGREPSIMVDRPLTQIEQRLTSRITNVFADELRKAWQGIGEMKPTVERVESSPARVRIVPDDDVVVVTRFDVSLGETRGGMALCIPVAALVPIGASLQAGLPRAHAGTGEMVELIADLAEARITASELADLQVGDIIATEQDAHAGVTLKVDGVTRFRGRPGAVQGHKAVCITDVEHD